MLLKGTKVNCMQPSRRQHNLLRVLKTHACGAVLFGAAKRVITVPALLKQRTKDRKFQHADMLHLRSRVSARNPPSSRMWDHSRHTVRSRGRGAPHQTLNRPNRSRASSTVQCVASSYGADYQGAVDSAVGAVSRAGTCPQNGCVKSCETLFGCRVSPRGENKAMQASRMLQALSQR